jgi:release factor glutamine methyltransferase
VLRWAEGDLAERGSTSPRLDAELLLAHVLGCDRVRLILDGERPLAPRELQAYRELHKRRRCGVPVAYLRGEREFFGRSFYVDARVLVPRPETEHLVEVAMARTRSLSLSARVIDVCTGSGCVAITLKRERPTTTVIASDISEDALTVARVNCARLGAHVGLVQSDVFESLRACAGKIDLITANPPYIPSESLAALPIDVRDFEPHLALVSGPKGLDLTARIVDEAPAMLAPGGVLAVEIDAPSGDAVRALFAAAGLAEIAVERDYAGRDRVVSGKRPS